MLARPRCMASLRSHVKGVLVKRKEEEEEEEMEVEKGLEPPTLQAHLLEIQLHRRTGAYRTLQ